MSTANLTWAFRQGAHQKLPTGTRMLLLVLANRANGELFCFPSLSQLAEDTGLSERGVRNALRQLERACLIRTEHRPQTQSTYHVIPALTAPPEVNAPPTGTHCPTQEELSAPPPRHSLPPESYKKESYKNPSLRSGGKHAQRCPDDWCASQSLVEFGAGLGFTEAEVDEAAKAMRDWSASSPKGCKLDWNATFRNWLRSEAKRRPRQSHNATDLRAATAQAILRTKGSLQ